MNSGWVSILLQVYASARHPPPACDTELLFAPMIDVRVQAPAAGSSLVNQVAAKAVPFCDRTDPGERSAAKACPLQIGNNGPEFTSRAFIGWARSHRIRHILMEPGRPMQNGYIESFNGRFRDECLNEHWFQTRRQARKEIAAWRLDYDEVRPHGSIGRMPLAWFAEQHRRHAGDAAQKLTPNNELR
jgi:hypothetical protein